MHLLIQSYQIRLGRLSPVAYTIFFYPLMGPNETTYYTRHSANSTTNTNKFQTKCEAEKKGHRRRMDNVK